MAGEPEYLVGLHSLLAQMSDDAQPALTRISATNLARTYLEALTVSLVNQARDDGATWLAVAEVLGTSEQNVKARFSALHGSGD